MVAGDTYGESTDAVDAMLRQDIRELGQILGEVIREQWGDVFRARGSHQGWLLVREAGPLGLERGRKLGRQSGVA